MVRSINTIAVVTLAVVTAGCAKATSQAAANQIAAGDTPAPGTHTGAFVVRLGTDTIVVEKFARSGNTYSVEQALRSRRRGCSTRTSPSRPPAMSPR